MATVEYRICDRCGKPINPASFARVRGRIYRHRVFGFGPYDYSDAEYDLCRDCSDELDEFLRAKKEADNDR